MLRDAGLAFDVDAADVDEVRIGAAERDPARRAALLARDKALAVSARQRGRVVVGADQVGVLEDGTFLEKPRDTEDHLRLLMAMSGRVHRFFPRAAVVVDGRVRDEVGEVVAVRFRAFPIETARAYVAAGEGGGSCGGYESEHRGVQLIESVDGSLHAVLGLPLLPLLSALRRLGVSGLGA
jgi:septum formation protein